MTQHESDKLNQLIGKLEEYFKNDAEHKVYVTNELTNLRQVLADEQKKDDQRFKHIETELSGDKGIKVRLTKLEQINKNALKIVTAIASFISGAIVYIWDELITAIKLFQR